MRQIYIVILQKKTYVKRRIEPFFLEPLIIIYGTIINNK